MLGTIEISLEAIRANARAITQLVAPAKVAFVVKGNAYGHGIVPVAKTVAPMCDALCVYNIDEALELRRNGISSRIIVLGPVASERIADALANDVATSLWDSHAYLKRILETARNYGKPLRVHIKVDTGLSRLGFEPQQLADALSTCESAAGAITVEGVFSHLASAEELDSPYTTLQLERFLDALKRHATNAPYVRHIAASAAAMLWPQTRLDMVRVGIALYGLWPSAQTREAMNGANAVELQPALSYRSTLVAIRRVSAGTPVGYGSTYHTPRDTRIGVVPLGYTDGIPRALSNTGAFLVRGVRCPIAGRVAMNMTMVDLAHAPDVEVGDQVTLIGSDGAETISADDWAMWAGTINYEIVTRMPAHVPREYREPGNNAER